MKTTEHGFTKAEIEMMREWLADCDWADMDAEDFADVADAVIIRAVSKFYDGGIAAFDFGR